MIKDILELYLIKIREIRKLSDHPVDGIKLIWRTPNDWCISFKGSVFVPDRFDLEVAPTGWIDNILKGKEDKIEVKLEKEQEKVRKEEEKNKEVSVIQDDQCEGKPEKEVLPEKVDEPADDSSPESIEDLGDKPVVEKEPLIGKKPGRPKKNK